MQVRRTDDFAEWLENLRDRDGKRRIEQRLDRVAVTGNLGDTKYLGGDVSELRLHFGPGYRLYFTLRGATAVFLLVGGDKGSQHRDILKAQTIASMLEPN